jgi:hypothetical protein
VNGADTAPAIFFVVVLVLVLVIAIAAVSNSLNRGALETVAKRWKGYVEPSGFIGHPEVVMQIGDAYARLSYSSNSSRNHRGSRCTHLAIHFPDKQLRLEMTAQNLLQQLRKLMGMYDLEIGSPLFDDAFIINGNNPELIREYLTTEAQRALLELAKFGSMLSPDLHLTIHGGVLRVTKHRLLKSAGELNGFISHFEKVFTALAYGRNSGIEFVASSPLPQVQETQCQVCGQPLAGKIVFCASCQTPHHLDCWLYLESCAVYGCGQHRYLESRRSA